MESYKNEWFFYNKIVTAESTASRILEINNNWTLTKSRPIYGGMVSTGVYAHEILSQHGKRKTIIEKIYGQKLKKLGVLEALLFKEIDHHRLSAPVFYGSVDFNDYLSVFYEYVKPNRAKTIIRKLMRDKNNNLIENIVISLWGAKPPTGLLSRVLELSPGRFSQIEKGLNKDNIIRLCSAVSSKKDKQLAEALLSNYNAYVNRFKSRPKFVMHGDLHNFSNIIIQNNGHPVLIDWDKWYISSVGGGLRIKPKHFMSRDLGKKINHFCKNHSIIDPLSIWENIAIENIGYSLKCKKWPLALEWTIILGSLNN